MKRLLLITIMVVAFALVGVLHGGYIQENRVADSTGGLAYPENAAQMMPAIIFYADGLTLARF
jgi:hypothetical protein